MDWRKLISVDQDVCHGRACFVGTRVMVSVVLDNLAAGVAEGEILSSYPSLDGRHVRAAVAFGAALARARERGVGSWVDGRPG